MTDKKPHSLLDAYFRMRAEQESKSEWEHDHEILKAYSDGANEVLDEIRAEIESASHGKWYVGRIDGKSEEVLLLDEVLKIIDKYKEDT